MKTKKFDVTIIGAGAAGLSAAKILGEMGVKTAIVDRENTPGGILNQCIHNGFGLHYFREELTGPEYAYRFVDKVFKNKLVEPLLETTVVDIENRGEVKHLYAYSKSSGVTRIKSRAVLLAMGARERNRGNIGIPGTRPSGIFTAGLAQRFVNIDGLSPGNEVVIVGSGDIGLIMARRMTWIGAKVKAVIEIQPYPSGLTRNIVQCLNDFNIPLYLSHVVSKIYGDDRIEGVEVSPIESGIVNKDKSFNIKCDTLLLSVGLIPENELSKKVGITLNPETNGPLVDSNLMTSIDGIFSAGNVLHIHDLVDFVTMESERAARSIINYLEGKLKKSPYKTFNSSNVKYVIPNSYNPETEQTFLLRPMIVKNNARLRVTLNGVPIVEKKLIHIQPSEMISIKIGPEKMINAVGKGKENTLVFSIL